MSCITASLVYTIPTSSQAISESCQPPAKGNSSAAGNSQNSVPSQWPPWRASPQYGLSSMTQTYHVISASLSSLWLTVYGRFTRSNRERSWFHPNSGLLKSSSLQDSSETSQGPPTLLRIVPCTIRLVPSSVCCGFGQLPGNFWSSRLKLWGEERG